MSAEDANADNCKADELTREVTLAPLTSKWDRVGPPLPYLAF